MPVSQVKFRKRAPQKQTHQPPLAPQLRELGVAISRRQHAGSLAGINETLRTTRGDALASGRLLALAGDSEFKRSKYADARQLYDRAAGMLADHPRHWLRPLMGSLRACLKDGHADESVVLAGQIAAEAMRREADHTAFIARAHVLMASQSRVVVPPAPLRASTICARMGELFLAHGETGAAGHFFHEALRQGKPGSVKARIGLARIASAEKNADAALRYAREAILMGKASAKTLCCWPILIAARRQIGGWMIADDLLDCVRRAPRSVRARATVIIVTEMRKHDMRQWSAFALEWLAADGRLFPAAEAEIKKMILASWKTVPGRVEEKGEAAKRLLQTARLSKNEWLAGIKQVVLSGIMLKKAIDPENIVAKAARHFDPAFGFRVRHSLALTCMQARAHETARALLRQNMDSPECPVRICSRAVWALGRMERALGNHAAAAEAFEIFASSEKFELKFRLQARLWWVESMVAAGQAGALVAAREQISAALEDIKDSELLMNTARQMRALAPELDTLAFQLFDRASGYARSAFQNAAEPGPALDILFKLTRRMVCDFDRNGEAVKIWEQLPAERRNWLWQANAHYWEYLGLLVSAYSRTGQRDVAEKMARDWMADPSVPVHGRVHIIIALAKAMLEAGQIHDALILFGDLVLESPAHPLSALAWYWLALEAHGAGDHNDRDASASALRRALGPTPGLLEEWRLDARALVLLNNLDSRVNRTDRVQYDDAFMVREADAIRRDLARLP